MTERESKNISVDPNALVQEVLRESYLQTTEDLRFYAEKVRSFNESKKAVRAYLTALREFKANVIFAARERGVDLCRGDKKDLAILAELFGQYAHAYEVGEVEHGQCIPARVPLAVVDGVGRLEAEIARWEVRLASMGDDAQLANVDLQNVLQKQQQTLQMMSNISKLLHHGRHSEDGRVGGAGCKCRSDVSRRGVERIKRDRLACVDDVAGCRTERCRMSLLGRISVDSGVRFGSLASAGLASRSAS